MTPRQPNKRCAKCMTSSAQIDSGVFAKPGSKMPAKRTDALATFDISSASSIYSSSTHWKELPRFERLESQPRK